MPGKGSRLKKVRGILVGVARGEVDTHHYRKIGYKELWLLIYPDGSWGQAYTKEVVDWIVDISDVDVEKGLPPLNSLVVRQDSGQPGVDWEAWHKEAGSPFESLSHAQAACWAYWPTKDVVSQYCRLGED